MTHVFVVEDSPSQAALMESLLTEAGYAVSTFAHGRAALDAIDAQPDLILSDIWMPEMDGLSLCRAIKRQAAYQHIPVILVTASNKFEELLSGLNALADGFLNKPYNVNVLIQTIDSLVQRKQAGTILPPATSMPMNVTVAGTRYELVADRARVFDFFSIALLNASVQTRALEERERKLKDTNAELARHVGLLSSSDEHFRSLIAAVPDIVYRLDAGGHFTFLNDAIGRLGYANEALIGKHFSALVHPDDMQHASAEIVLPQLAGRTVAGAPKLFNERRTQDRMTVGLRVRLLASPAPTPDVHPGSSAAHVHVEVNSVGLYSESTRTGRKFVGTVGIIRDISERLRVERELTRTREAAESASRAKSEFLSSMSHELRTPLNAILGFGQLLATPEVALDTQQQQFVRHIIDGGQHLLRLIDDILDLARIETGGSSLDIQATDPAPLLQFALDAADSIARARQVTLRCAHATPLPHILIDSTRFRQVLLNLLSNAIKYNHPHGQVTVSCVPYQAYLRFSVADTGPGIAEDAIPQLFQPFNRLGHASGGIEGTGIGLVITKRLVEEMGGRIGVHSRIGCGTTFWTDFPLNNDAAHLSAAPMPAQATHAPTAPSYARAVSVLYVEDNNVNALLMKRYLARVGGLELSIRETAEDGIEFARAHRPDLILMDLRLPGMNGIDAIRALRTCPETAPIPIIAVTADAMAHDITRAMDAGSNCHLAKPIDLGELYERLRQTIPA